MGIYGMNSEPLTPLKEIACHFISMAISQMLMYKLFLEWCTCACTCVGMRLRMA